MDPALLLLAAVVAVAGGTWSLIGVLQWRRAWRWLASAPIAAFVLWVAIDLVPDCVEDPTSHSLWPFNAGLWFWPSLPYMAVIALLRRDRIARTGSDAESNDDAEPDRRI